MIDDDEAVELLTELANKMGTSKRSALRVALENCLKNLPDLFDVVELIKPFDQVPAGTRGTVVHLHEGACEVEFEVRPVDTVAVPVISLRTIWRAPKQDA